MGAHGGAVHVDDVEHAAHQAPLLRRRFAHEGGLKREVFQVEGHHVIGT
jgi:hypothetical protein